MVTRNQLQSMVDTLNALRPKLVEYRLKLDISNGGYRLTKIVNESGGETDLSPRCTANEMKHYLEGMFMALKLIYRGV